MTTDESMPGVLILPVEFIVSGGDVAAGVALVARHLGFTPDPDPEPEPGKWAWSSVRAAIWPSEPEPPRGSMPWPDDIRASAESYAARVTRDQVLEHLGHRFHQHGHYTVPAALAEFNHFPFLVATARARELFPNLTHDRFP